MKSSFATGVNSTQDEGQWSETAEAVLCSMESGKMSSHPAQQKILSSLANVGEALSFDPVNFRPNRGFSLLQNC
jgi:hypothetical protein